MKQTDNRASHEQYERYNQTRIDIETEIKDSGEFPFEYLDHEDPQIRQIAVAAYRWNSDYLTPAIDYTIPILPLLEDVNPIVRKEAVETIVRLSFQYHFDNEEIINRNIELVAKIQDQREYFLKLLSSIARNPHTKKIVPAFRKYAEEALSSEDPDMQVAGADLYYDYVSQGLVKHPFHKIKNWVQKTTDPHAKIQLISSLTHKRLEESLHYFGNLKGQEAEWTLALSLLQQKKFLRNDQKAKEYLFKSLLGKDLDLNTKSIIAWVAGKSFSSLEPMYWQTLVSMSGDDKYFRGAQQDLMELVDNAACILIHPEDYPDEIPDLQKRLSELLEDENSEIAQAMIKYITLILNRVDELMKLRIDKQKAI